MQDCTDAGKKLWDLIWVDTDKCVDPAHKKLDRDEETRQNSNNLTCFSVFLCNATFQNCEGVGLNHDVCELVELDYVNLICGEPGGLRSGNHSAASFHNSNQDVRMAVHGDDFVCLSDDDGLNHIDTLLKSKYAAKDMGT